MNVLGMLDSLWQIVVFALLIGAGLPAIFALGLRALAPASPVAADGAPAGSETPGPARRVAAGACFAIVVAAVVAGIWLIAVAGH